MGIIDEKAMSQMDNIEISPYHKSQTWVSSDLGETRGKTKL